MANEGERAQGLRRQALEKYFSGLNDMQRRAVFHIDGPLLILAGAGSGKTTVLINRIENMVLFGGAWQAAEGMAPPRGEDEQVLRDYIAGGAVETGRLAAAVGAYPVRPWNILAITFTNKAAGELRARLESRLGPEIASDVQASTFHSLCVRILRREIEALGYGRSFTIYDADDSQRAVKDAVKALDLDEKLFQPRAVLSAISRAKDSLQTPQELEKGCGGDYRMQQIAKIYARYTKSLHAANALDFDDLIALTVRLFQQEPAVLERYRQRYRYIMVDEYQDTNHAQYMLISLLAEGHHNLCVVGDDDQSIYKFRGATIENILSFEEEFPGAEVIRLEQNYRSTAHILDAANAVIANNTERKGKNLWTSAGEGEPLKVLRLRDEEEESARIADAVLDNVQAGAKFSDHAVLYRMNAQSNAVEKAFAKNAIPYRIIGGVRFYERKEIKDMTAYLSVLHNPADNLRLARIINEPKRGIGAATVAAAQEIAAGMGLSLYEVISAPDQFAALSKKAAALGAFTAMMDRLREAAEELPLAELLEQLVEQTGYRMMLDGQGLEGSVRMENIMELKSNLIRYSEENEDASLGGFLEEISLYTDLDNYDASADSVVLMTIHSAKGLEFPYVFIAGMDEGIFPGRNAMNFPPEIEEERRLAYVAITRAKRRLTITSAQRRLLFGQTIYGNLSRFVGEIPKDHIELEDATAVRYAAATATSSGQGGGRTTAPSTPAPGGRTTAPGRSPRKGPAGSATSIGVGMSARPAGGGQSFAPGERVGHKVYGEGEILSARPMGGDTLLEIAFASGEKKKIMANFAKLQKL